MSLDYTADDVVRYRDNLEEALREGKESIESGRLFVESLRSETSDLAHLIAALPNAPIYEAADRTRVISDRLMALTNGSLENVIHQVTRFDRHIDLIAGAMPCEDGIRNAIEEHESCHSDEDFDEALAEVPDDHYCEQECDDEQHMDVDDALVTNTSTAGDDLEAGYIEASRVAEVLRQILDGPVIKANVTDYADRLEAGNTAGTVYGLDIWPVVADETADEGAPAPISDPYCSREHVSSDWVHRDRVLVSTSTSASEDFTKGWMSMSMMSEILEAIRQGDYQRENLAQLIYEMRRHHLSDHAPLDRDEWPKVKGLVQ